MDNDTRVAETFRRWIANARRHIKPHAFAPCKDGVGLLSVIQNSRREVASEVHSKGIVRWVVINPQPRERRYRLPVKLQADLITLEPSDVAHAADAKSMVDIRVPGFQRDVDDVYPHAERTARFEVVGDGAEAVYTYYTKHNYFQSQFEAYAQQPGTPDNIPQESGSQVTVAPVQLYCAYHSADESVWTRLEAHLRSAAASKPFEIWDATKLVAGQEIRAATNKKLGQAQIILLLASADFLSCENCSDIVRRATERHRLREATVIPILARPVNWQDGPFGELTPLPSTGDAIAGDEEAIAAVAREICRAAESIRSRGNSVRRPTYLGYDVKKYDRVDMDDI